MRERKNLTRYAWLSIGTAVFTIGLKAAAFWLTGSVGLLSDALESGVNLLAAIFALITLAIAALPPDEEHAYGHAKAEYFSCGAEGTLILIAALTIAYTAVRRIILPEPIEQVGIGLAVSMVAALGNWVTARVLLQAGQKQRSVTLEANARHLMTDVWTTGGVVAGVGLVALTGWEILDPIIALLVAGQIVYSGVKLLRHAVLGLMDTALPAAELEKVLMVLQGYRTPEIQYHALRTRQSGAHRFISVHIQVPGAWSVQKGHTLLEKIDQDLRQAIYPVSVFTHLEPIEDPASWEDIGLYRED